ncbi:hypothetical protein L195_g060524, partial [Trifolium pratense]
MASRRRAPFETDRFDCKLVWNPLFCLTLSSPSSSCRSAFQRRRLTSVHSPLSAETPPLFCLAFGEGGDRNGRPRLAL